MCTGLLASMSGSVRSLELGQAYKVTVSRIVPYWGVASLQIITHQFLPGEYGAVLMGMYLIEL